VLQRREGMRPCLISVDNGNIIPLMKYRRFDNIGMEVSALGFGCMRLPTRGDDPKIDEPLAIEMIRYAIDNGVNYIDTAYPYHSGNSEKLLGKALKDGYRAKVNLTTKMPIWLVEKRDDFDRFFNEQLKRLEVNSLDFYLLHNVKKEWWSKLRKLGILEWAEKTMARGRFKYFGFSFHDTYEVFKEIIDSYDGWTICQIQYNYMNEDTQAGTRGLEYAAGKGLSVVIMEPLLGGNIVKPPRKVQKIFDSASKSRTPADWALQWLWNKPEVSLVLSGMSNMQQVRENVESACRSGIATLAQDELDVIARVQEEYRGFYPIPCTKCGYCMPCPNGVDIPRNFDLYNDGIAFNHFPLNKNIYLAVFPEDIRASECVQCKECEEHCPQNIQISEWMPRVHQKLSSG